jgi:restriction endonuclease S subunit
VTWPTMRLSDAYWLQEGPGVRNWQFTTSGIKLLNISNIEKNGAINLSKTDRHLSYDEATTKYKHFLCEAGDLVIASSGISIDDDGLLRTRGGFIQEEHLPLCINTSTIRFKALKNNNLIYLKHWLQSRDFREQITRLVTGSAQLNFGPSHLKQLKIKLPPLAEQQRIAAILDKAEEIKRKREQAIAKLDQLAQSTFDHMFNHNKNLKKLKLIDLVQKKKLLDKNEDTDQTKVWNLTLDQIESGGGEINGFVQAGKSEIGNSTYYFEPPVVLYSKLRPYLNKVVMPEIDGYATTELVPLYCNEELISPVFLLNYLKSKSFVAFANTNSGGAKMPRVMMDKFWTHEIKVPPKLEQKKFEQVYDQIKAQKAILKSNLMTQDLLLSSLQDQAFTTGFRA